MLHARPRIPRPLGLPPRSPFIRIMHGLSLDARQLGHPFPDILALGIEPLPLPARVEDAEMMIRIWGWGIHAAAAATGAERPTPVIAREIAIDQMFHEIALAEAPIQQEVIGQKGGDGHAGAVVHVPRGVQLAHAGVDKGEACAAAAPEVEEEEARRGCACGFFLPADVAVGGLVVQGFGHADVRVAGEDVLVEVAPGELGDPGPDALVVGVAVDEFRE
ncbi:MAG: hypothetical protein Q9177_000965 [Variospora cf. flavescens]